MCDFLWLKIQYFNLNPLGWPAPSLQMLVSILFAVLLCAQSWLPTLLSWCLQSQRCFSLKVTLCWSTYLASVLHLEIKAFQGFFLSLVEVWIQFYPHANECSLSNSIYKKVYNFPNDLGKVMISPVFPPNLNSPVVVCVLGDVLLWKDLVDSEKLGFLLDLSARLIIHLVVT